MLNFVSPGRGVPFPGKLGPEEVASRIGGYSETINDIISGFINCVNNTCRSSELQENELHAFLGSPK